jgi:hypothetical protein
MQRKHLKFLGSVTGFVGVSLLYISMSGGGDVKTSPPIFVAVAKAAETTPKPQEPKKVEFTPPLMRLTGINETVPYGEIVDIKAQLDKASPNDYVRNFATVEPDIETSIKYKWKVYTVDLQTGKLVEKVNVRVVDKGDEIWFGSGIKPVIFHVVVGVSVHMGTVNHSQHEHFVDVLQGDVVVGGDVPSPAPPIPPGPNPPPGPQPPGPVPPVVFPDGKYKLSAFTFDAVNASVPVEQRAKGAAALAENFAGIASKIAAGGYKESNAGTIYETSSGALTAALKETQQGNTDSLAKAKVSKDAWVKFLQALSDKIYSLYQAKSLNTVADLKTAWDEVVIGLKGIK